ncbi:monocarboxylate transporter 12-B-like [Mytilus trossulus]|uniref:monocarboxylate transporter 12-B-like n=1 Tax=Mytilus trossulus TaxID=6551 RepID=UPI003004F336
MGTRTPRVSPDGGWGWAVVLGCFLVHLIMDGFVYAFGVFYIEFLDYFGSDKGTTALIGSLLNGMYLFAGPIASVLTNRFGPRVVTVVGGIISSVGFAASAFAPNIYWLCITFGVIPGIGAAFMYVAAISCVGQYFERKRAFAMGIALCGTGIGTFVLAPLTEYLIELYTWRGAVLIAAGIMLNCVVGGLFFRPIHLKMKLEETEDLNINKREVISAQDSSEEKSSLIVGKSDSYLYQKSSDLCDSNVTRSQSNMETHINKDLVFNKSTSSISSPKTINNTKRNIWTNVDHFLKKLYTIFGCSMCLDIVYIFFVISSCFGSLGSGIPYIYIPDRAYEVGISKTDASFLLSVAGMANTVARLVFGWIASREFSNPSIIYGISILLCGISTFVSPFNDSHAFLVCYSVLFGASAGVYICLNAIVLVHFVGIDNLTSSFGNMLLFKGLFLLIGTPAAGWLFDETGSYAITFYSDGIILCLSSVLLFIGYALNINKQKKSRETSDVLYE